MELPLSLNHYHTWKHQTLSRRVNHMATSQWSHRSLFPIFHYMFSAPLIYSYILPWTPIHSCIFQLSVPTIIFKCNSWFISQFSACITYPNRYHTCTFSFSWLIEDHLQRCVSSGTDAWYKQTSCIMFLYSKENISLIVTDNLLYLVKNSFNGNCLYFSEKNPIYFLVAVGFLHYLMMWFFFQNILSHHGSVWK